VLGPTWAYEQCNKLQSEWVMGRYLTPDTVERQVSKAGQEINITW